MELLKSGGKT